VDKHLPDTSLNKIGPRTAVIIGFPLGMGFGLGLLYLSLFPGLDFGIFVSGAGLFWHPLIWAGIIPASFIFLLWKAGKKIKLHLDRDFPLLKTSFLFTFYINNRLFSLLLLLYFISQLYTGLMPSEYLGKVNWMVLKILFWLYVIFTVLTSLTIGLLIVYITKSRIASVRKK
jgi:hypothetical protein